MTCARAGHGDAAEPLDRHQIRQLAHHAAEIVDAVAIGDEAVPGLALGHLFGAAVVIADVGGGPDDLLAIEAEDDLEDAVGRGVVRAEVERHQLERRRGGWAGRELRGRRSRPFPRRRNTRASCGTAAVRWRGRSGSCAADGPARSAASGCGGGCGGRRSGRRTCRRLRARTSRRWGRRAAIEWLRGSSAAQAVFRRMSLLRSSETRWLQTVTPDAGWPSRCCARGFVDAPEVGEQRIGPGDFGLEEAVDGRRGFGGDPEDGEVLGGRLFAEDRRAEAGAQLLPSPPALPPGGRPLQGQGSSRRVGVREAGRRPCARRGAGRAGVRG